MSENTRRDLLRTTVIAGSAAVASWLEPRAAVAEPVSRRPVASRNFSYFSAPEIVFIDAAIGRLIPAD